MMVITLILRETGPSCQWDVGAVASHTSVLQCKSKEFWTPGVRACYETASRVASIPG